MWRMRPISRTIPQYCSFKGREDNVHKTHQTWLLGNLAPGLTHGCGGREGRGGKERKEQKGRGGEGKG